jgi:tetratricopeptide (TPR) repeat protein
MNENLLTSGQQTAASSPSAVVDHLAEESRAAGSHAPQSSTRLTPVTVAPPALGVEELLRDEKVAALVMSARLSQRRARKDEAKTQLQQALALNSTDAGALELLGDVFLEEGEHQTAIVVFKKGQKHHPQHAAFEEKIAIAQLDIEEMKNDALARQFVLENGDINTDQDVKPTRLMAVSLLLPGAGHFLQEKYERGGLFLGLAVLSFVGWAWPLNSAMGNAGAAIKQSGSVLAGWGGALSSMGAFTRAWFWLMVTLWLASYVASAWDAARVAAQAREDRRRALGL